MPEDLTEKFNRRKHQLRFAGLVAAKLLVGRLDDPDPDVVFRTVRQQDIAIAYDTVNKPPSPEIPAPPKMHTSNGSTLDGSEVVVGNEAVAKLTPREYITSDERGDRLQEALSTSIDHITWATAVLQDESLTTEFHLLHPDSPDSDRAGWGKLVITRGNQDLAEQRLELYTYRDERNMISQEEGVMGAEYFDGDIRFEIYNPNYPPMYEGKTPLTAWSVRLEERGSEENFSITGSATHHDIDSQSLDELIATDERVLDYLGRFVGSTSD